MASTLVYADLDNPCHKCGGEFRYIKTKRCVVCMRAWVKQSRDTTPLRKEMVGHPCEICGEAMAQPCFDEDKEGNHRGWLCHLCNVGLGRFRDDVKRLEAAIRYLEKGGSPSFSVEQESEQWTYKI